MDCREIRNMKKIGILVGQEKTFPEALIENINGRNLDLRAEMCLFEGTPHSWSGEYAVILDRISHEVAYYQTTLKVAQLNGCTVVNNPFWKLADDKFFGTALVEKLGIAVPRTLALPQCENVEGITSESLRNIKYPLDWEGIMGWIGFPAILKPHWGGGWKSVDKVNNMEELMEAYHASKTLCMMLQEFIEWEQYVRCICIGKNRINVLPWDPSLPHHERYAKAKVDLSEELKTKITEQAIALNEALGYDMNTVEFAIRDGIPYAIDFMNSAPDLDRSSLTEEQFHWAVQTMGDFLIEKALEPRSEEAPLRWNDLLSQ